MAKKATKSPAKKGTSTPSTPDVGDSQTFRFTAPAAGSVLLAGDFTQWQKQPIPMQSDAHGVWTATVALPPGTYHYRFIVDGEWLDDPDCALRVPTPFGSENSVRVVG